MWSITYWIISCLAVKKVQEGDTEGGWCKPLQWLSARWVEKYSCFFNHFQKVPKYLMCDELFHLGHLLSLPSSTFQRGYFFFPPSSKLNMSAASSHPALWRMPRLTTSQLPRNWLSLSCKAAPYRRDVPLVLHPGIPRCPHPGKTCQPLLTGLSSVWW